MSSLVVNSLSNVNVYLNGTSYLGTAAEVKIPQPKRMRTDYKGLGMAARIKIPTGWDVMEASIKWSSFDADVIAEIALSSSACNISCLGDLQTIAAGGEIQEQPVIFNFTGIPYDVGDLQFKAQDLVEFTTQFDVWHVDLSVGGNQIYLFDAFSNQYIVNGVDQLATYRANIGS
jgi:P2 family phage contractile tail tube protein